MSGIPMLSAAQWRLIEPLLPEIRRDPVLIAAILYRETAAASVRDVCAIFNTTRTRLNTAETELKASGALPRIMGELRLTRAGALQWRRGGRPWYRVHAADRGAAVEALRLARFGDELRRAGRGEAGGAID
jgi:hypothetical protein